MHACLQVCTVGGRLAMVSNLTVTERETERERERERGEAGKVEQIECEPWQTEGQEGGAGVWLQSHEGDVSTCHIVVITCAAVAARLVVVTVV